MSIVARALLTVAVVALPPATAAIGGESFATIEPCVAQRLPDLEQSLALEFGHRSRASNPAATPPHITFGCDGARISIRAVSADGATRLERTLDLVSTPAPAHARLTAVAAIELAEPLWGTPTKQEATAPVALASPSAAMVVARNVSPVQPEGDRNGPGFWRLSLLSDARAFRGGSGLLFGGGISLSAGGTRHPWLATVDLIADRTSQSFTLGRGTVTLISARPAVMASIRLRAATVVGGAGLRVGAARFAGEPATSAAVGDTFWGLWGGPLLLAGTSIAVARQVAIAGTLETGWSPSELVGRQGSVRAISVGGVWAGVQLGIELRP